MGKLLRTASTAMILIGLVYLFIYTQSQNIDRLSILERPSYYALQNFSHMFVAGVVVVLFSVLGSFFSWFKKMDPESEALPNAGYASQKDIHIWVSGESGTDPEEVAPSAPGKATLEQTEILVKTTEIISESTEILPEDDVGSGDTGSETEILRQEDEV